MPCGSKPRSAGARWNSSGATGSSATRRTAITAPRTCRSVPCQACPLGVYVGGGSPAASQAQRLADRALAALGGPRSADQRAEFHDGGVPAHRGAGVVREQRRRQPHFGGGQGLRGQGRAGDQPRVDPADVGVHHRFAASEGERGDGRRRVAAHAGELQEVGVGAGDRPAVAVPDGDGGRVQAQRAPGIAQPAPGPDGLPGGFAGQIGGSGQRRSHSSQTGRTRTTGVCWSITSLTSTPQGVHSAARHGSSLALDANQSSRAAWRAGRSRQRRGRPGGQGSRGAAADTGGVGARVSIHSA